MIKLRWLIGCWAFSEVATAQQWLVERDDISLGVAGRYRFQQVDDPLRGDAKVNTLKVRGFARWQWSDAWSGYVEGDAVQALDPDAYNSVAVLRPTAPVPEPEGNELNQLYLAFAPGGNWQARLGRQQILLSNQRHVGDVGFWQNDQTFDALTFTYQDHVNWRVHYSAITKAHRIFGDDARSVVDTQQGVVRRPAVQLGNHQHRSHLLDVEYRVNPNLTLAAFTYRLDNESAAVLSSNTTGVRVEGNYKPATVGYGYRAEYARQRAAYDNPWDYSANYLHLQLSARVKSHQVLVDLERLGDDNGFGFNTSLGSNHRFNGWADVFNGYFGGGGLEDLALTYRGRAARLRWKLVAHRFSDPASGATAGTEWDVEVVYRYSRHWEIKGFAGFYRADEGLPALPVSNEDISTWAFSVTYNL